MQVAQHAQVEQAQPGAVVVQVGRPGTDSTALQAADLAHEGPDAPWERPQLRPDEAQVPQRDSQQRDPPLRSRHQQLRRRLAEPRLQEGPTLAARDLPSQLTDDQSLGLKTLQRDVKNDRSDPTHFSLRNE